MFGELPMVSVVTPSYNTGPYLRATIDSVLAQGYPNLEHLVMDGGSTDETRAILASYPHLDWVSERDRGQSDALNKGFARARGEFIGWLNADDIYEPGALFTAVRYLLEHPHVDAVYGDVWIIDEQNRRIGSSRGAPFDPVRLLTSNMVKQPGMIMRRRLLERHGVVDENVHYVMDQELWLRAAMGGAQFRYLPGACLAGFRMCQGTKSFDNVPKFRLEWQEILQRVLDDPFFDALAPDVKQGILEHNRAEYHLALMMDALEARDRASTLRHLRAAVSTDRRLAWNRGTWRFAAMGLLGVRPDRLRKYRKQKA